jgi:hypothetical protein
MGILFFQTKEPKVCAGDLLKSPLNLTDFFLPRPQQSCRPASRVCFDLNILKSKI